MASIDPWLVLARVKRHEIDPQATVLSLSTPMQIALTPDMSLTAALERFLRENATALPVTSGSWRTTLLGEVLRHDLLLALQDRMSHRPCL
jgi:hypothetical protein